MICTIVIPTKDRPQSLLGAVRSALSALPDGGEIVVIDDAGKIPATETLSALSSEKIRVLENPGPHGPAEARNFGVKQAKGKVIFFLDDDDEFLPDYCNTVLSRSYPEDCVYGHCAPLHMETNGAPTYHGKKQETGVYGDESELGRRLAGLGMGFWIRTDVFVSSGGIDTQLRVNEDTEFCIRLSSLGFKSFYDREPGVLLRHDQTRAEGDTSSITKSASALERARGFEYILARHSGYLLLHPKFRRLLMSRVIKYRSRAKTKRGFLDFAKGVQPLSDRLLLLSLGRLFLSFSIAMRKKG